MSMMAQPQHSHEISRFDPFEELRHVEQQLARAIQSLGVEPPFEREFVPVADIEETDDAFLIELELPGIKKSAIDIEVANRRVVITGERQERQRTGVVRRRNRIEGRFRYEVMLNADVDEDHVQAALDDGVLSVKIPKSKADHPRRIEVH
jgi:HSP20 family protein